MVSEGSKNKIWICEEWKVSNSHYRKHITLIDSKWNYCELQWNLANSTGTIPWYFLAGKTVSKANHKWQSWELVSSRKIKKRVSEWQHCTVIRADHECPGQSEGRTYVSGELGEIDELIISQDKDLKRYFVILST